MNQSERLVELRNAAPGVFGDAVHALAEQRKAANALAEAHKAHGKAVAVAATGARQLLKVVCETPGISMLERAGWSTAFHQDHRTLTGIDDFAARASKYQDRLTAIDAALREPGAPILSINPGPVGNFMYERAVMGYAVTRSDGSGLDIHQADNPGQKWYYHWVSTSEEPWQEGRSIHRGFNGNRRGDAAIDQISTHELLKACIDPVDIAKQLPAYTDRDTNSRYYVIGNEAIAEFFTEGARPHAAPHIDMLRGAVAQAGVVL